MSKGYYMVTRNGNTQQGTFEGDFDRIIRGVLLEGFNFLDGVKLTQDAPRFNKQVCSAPFPPSTQAFDSSRQLVIPVAATGCKDGDVYVEITDNYIVVQFQKEVTEKEQFIYAQRGLKLPTNERLIYKFNPLYHDPNTMKVDLDAGLLVITMQPREALKPQEDRVVFGKKKEIQTEQE